MAEAAGLRRVQVDRPFTDGYVSDLPPEHLGPRMAARLENMIFPAGVARRRRGRGSQGFAVTGLGAAGGVSKSWFAREKASRQAFSGYATGGSTARLRLYSNGITYPQIDQWTTATETPVIPRAMYRDELLLCAQDGVTPMARYGGSAGFARVTLMGGTNAANGQRHATLTTSSLPAGWGEGAFFVLGGGGSATTMGAHNSIRVNGGVAGGKTVPLERIVFGMTGLIWAEAVTPIGFAWPGIPVYEAGTLTAPTSSGNPVTATGQGVDWTLDNFLPPLAMGSRSEAGDAVIVFDSAGSGSMNGIPLTPWTTTTFEFYSKGYPNPSSYKIMRRMPFTDVAVFRNCLFGAGVKQHASRLYYNPPGHDIGISPKLADGRSGTYTGTVYVSPDPVKEFETEWVDVPTSFDGDPIVALLETDSALYVVKRGSVWRVTGDYPNFRVDKAGEACGCLDVRSAITDETGVYWCGDTGVWTVRSGVPFNLAGGPNRPGILDEWRKLMSEGVKGPAAGSTSRIVCGVAEGHLMVVVRTESGTDRCYVYDLEAQRWCGVFTNMRVLAAWSSRVPGESDRLYGLHDDASGPFPTEMSGMFREGGAANDAWPSGGGPSDHLAVAHTGSSFFFPGTVSQEHRLIDVNVAADLSCIATPVGKVDVKVAYGDAVGVGMDTTATVGDIDATVVSEVKRNEFRAGTRGRRHQLRLEQTVVDPDEIAYEVHEITGLVRPFGVRR